MLETKGRILVVSQDGEMPERLSEAMAHLDLAGRSYRPDEILREYQALSEVDAAIVSLEKLEDLDGRSFDRFLSLMDEWSIECLVLANEISGSSAAGHKWGHVTCASCGESLEMLKGRLATLVEMGTRGPRSNAPVQRVEGRDESSSHSIEEVTEEMRLAARVQEDFLPKELPVMEGIRFATLYRPASWLSGDIYDIMRLDESHVGFYIADVVGHGMPAALLTMFIKHALVTKRIEGHEYQIIEPGEVLAQLNADLIDQNLSNHLFVTACYGILNVQTLRLRISSAGHPPPILDHGDGKIEELEVSGSLLGVFENPEYLTEEFQLQRGETLIIYSDGAEEGIIAESNGETVRFREEFLALSGLDAQRFCDQLYDVIVEARDPRRPVDDTTVLAIELTSG